MKKLFKALQNLPNGVKKNDLFELIVKADRNSTRNVFAFKETGIIIPYDCIKETDFFVEIKMAEFENGEKLIINKDYMKFKEFQEVTVIDNTLGGSKTNPTITVSVGGINYYLPVKILSRYNIYYFINSKGDIHTAIKGKHIGSDRWLKASGNYYMTKESANNAKKNILLDYAKKDC